MELHKSLSLDNEANSDALNATKMEAKATNAGPNIAIQRKTFLLHIRKVPNSNLSPKSEYLNILSVLGRQMAITVCHHLLLGNILQLSNHRPTRRAIDSEVKCATQTYNDSYDYLGACPP
jgi:hypothetical protein